MSSRDLNSWNLLQTPTEDKPATETGAEANAESGESGEALIEFSDTRLETAVLDWLPDAIRNPLETLSSHPLLLSMLCIGAGYLIGKLIQLALGLVASRFASRTHTDVDDQLLAIARRPALTIPVLLSLIVVIAIAPLPDAVNRFTFGTLATIMLISILRAALKASHAILDIVAKHEQKNVLIETRTIPMFDIGIKVVLVAAAGYLFLAIWGIDPTAWLASAGVIGIAVGFAARDTLANLFSGIFIVADAPYKIGDYVVLDTGERGAVTHVGLRSTRLLTRDDIEITIPNAIIANAKIINESGGPFEKYRVRMPVGVAYGSDVDLVVDLLENVAKSHADILANPAPRVRMRAFGDSSLDFELMGWVSRPADRGRVLHELFMTVYKRFNEEGISIPFPQRDLHIRQNLPGIVDDGSDDPDQGANTADGRGD